MGSCTRTVSPSNLRLLGLSPEVVHLQLAGEIAAAALQHTSLHGSPSEGLWLWAQALDSRALKI